MKVEHEAPVGPPESFAAFEDALGEMPGGPDVVWHRFSTELAHADVAAVSSEVYLLQWIESFAPGNGTAVLEAVGEWADDNEMIGLLVCPVDMARWYRDRGRWKRTGRKFQHPEADEVAVEMMRKPIPRTPAPQEVSS
jgi:hypothetical protein